MSYKNLKAFCESKGMHLLEGLECLKVMEIASHQADSARDEWLDLDLELKCEFHAFMEAGRMMFAPVKS